MVHICAFRFLVPSGSDQSDHSEQNLSRTQPKVGQICSDLVGDSKELCFDVSRWVVIIVRCYRNRTRILFVN
jgi:hypothetical protein